MKTMSHILNPAVLSGPLVSLLVLAIAASSRLSAAPDATVTEPKTHTLFMGADLDLQVAGDFCRVRDVSGDSFIVNAKGVEHSVPMDKGLVNLKVQQSLKLTEASAIIADLKSDRVYTDANDPRNKFAHEQPGSTGSALADIAAGQAITTNISNAAAAHNTDPHMAAGAAAAQGNIASANQGAANAFASEQFSEANNVGNYVAKMQEELAKQLFDAMEVNFKVSSEQPLTRPYVVIIARYHDKDTNPPKYKSWIFAKALPPINGKPQKVHLVQGGFPLGFVMDDFKVHLFDRGGELATNVADNRVELTYNDAFKYVLLDYQSAHKGASLPAAPVMGRLPPGWHARLSSEQLSQPYFVKVSKDGMPLGTYADEAGSRPVTDPDLQSIVSEIRFTPTLDKGKPVEGMTKLRLGDIRI
jgi:hypothetical protein